MKYGILGDIHGNLSALRAAVDLLKDAGVDTIVSVGDVVGYGAAPGDCIAILRELDAVVVKGNHDAAAAGQIDLMYFNQFAREAVRWTQSVLDARDLDWLGKLPYIVDLEDCSVAHGTYHKPELFDYVQSPSDGDPSLDAMRRPVCFIGHTHLPVMLLRLADDPHRTAYTTEDFVHLHDARKALINVGSVGQPRDDDPRTAVAIFDSTEDTYSLRRVEYDIDMEAERIRRAGLPAVLADRLYLGV
jgi:diadenosine tetraphosphatase ApaH/serine/threonine PP2A family protein phosphatase